MNQSVTIIYLVIVIAAFYFLIIRPQMQRQRKQTQLVASLVVGDRVITAGGVYGTVAETDGEIVRLRIADGVVVEVAKGAIVQRAEQGPASEE